MYRVLEYGDETYLANEVGKSAGYYSQMTNPEDSRESIWFRAARDLFNLVRRNPQRGCDALQTFNTFVKRAIPGNSSLCVDSERRRTHKEWSEFNLAEIEDTPINEQITELEQHIEQAERLLEAKRAEAKREITKAAFGRLEKVSARR